MLESVVLAQKVLDQKGPAASNAISDSDELSSLSPAVRRRFSTNYPIQRVLYLSIADRGDIPVALFRTMESISANRQSALPATSIDGLSSRLLSRADRL